MNDNDLTQLLSRLGQLERDELSKGLPDLLATALCPPLPLFDPRRRHTWTAAEQEHIRGCRFCRQSAAAFRSRTELAPVPPLRLRLFSRPPHVQPHSGTNGTPAPEINLIALPGDNFWELTPAAGQTLAGEPVFRLPAELSQRCFGTFPDEDDQVVSVYLHVSVDPDGRLRPQLEVRPAPTHAPLLVILVFPTGLTQSLVVAVPVSPRPSTRSEPGLPLDREDLGLVFPEPDSRWQRGLELRRPGGFTAGSGPPVTLGGAERSAVWSVLAVWKAVEKWTLATTRLSSLWNLVQGDAVVAESVSAAFNTPSWSWRAGQEPADSFPPPAAQGRERSVPRNRWSLPHYVSPHPTRLRLQHVGGCE